MSKKKEKSEPYIYEYTSKYFKELYGEKDNWHIYEELKRKPRKIDALINEPTKGWKKQ